MSRYVGETVRFTKDPQVDVPLTVAYGFDHALGYFCDVFNAEDELVVEECSFFTGLTGPKLVDLVENKWGVQMDEDHKFRAMLDLPF